MTDDTQFTLGNHSAEIANIKARVESIDGKVDQLVKASEQMRGGYRALAAAGAIGGAIGAGVIKFVAFIKGGS